jgi:hypothetical protein
LTRTAFSQTDNHPTASYHSCGMLSSREPTR